MTAQDFRRLALSLNGAVESAHMGHPDFRVDNRIFATLHSDDHYGMVKVTPADQQRLIREHRETFSPENGAWGAGGSTRVHLDTASEEAVGEGLTLAWRQVLANGASRSSAPVEKPRRGRTPRVLAVLACACFGFATLFAQGGAPDQPSVTVRGQTYTPRSILARNMGSREDQETALTPHRMIGNVYYVGTRTLTSFLVTTPAGHILINTTYERNVPTIAHSVEQLGFKVSDIKFILGTHAHDDHQEGDAAMKQVSGAQVIVMQEDVPALQGLRPGGKPHPIDRTIRDGDTVTLGGTTLVARLTPGHTHGATTWTMTATDGGRNYNVVFASSYRSPGTIAPDVEREFTRTFAMLRSIPCDVPLGDHAAQFNMSEKFAKMKPGGPSPYIDPAHCWDEADIQEAMFHAQLELQRKAVR
jgi:metallo-beta-lactamase class B